MSVEVFSDKNENITRQKAATRATTITQGSMNTSQFRLTKANRVLLLVQIPAATLTKQLVVRTVRGHVLVQFRSVNSKTKMFLPGDSIISDSMPPWSDW